MHAPAAWTEPPTAHLKSYDSPSNVLNVLTFGNPLSAKYRQDAVKTLEEVQVSAKTQRPEQVIQSCARLRELGISRDESVRCLLWAMEVARPRGCAACGRLLEQYASSDSTIELREWEAKTIAEGFVSAFYSSAPPSSQLQRAYFELLPRLLDATFRTIDPLAPSGFVERDSGIERLRQLAFYAYKVSDATERWDAARVVERLKAPLLLFRNSAGNDSAEHAKLRRLYARELARYEMFKQLESTSDEFELDAIRSGYRRNLKLLRDQLQSKRSEIGHIRPEASDYETHCDRLKKTALISYNLEGKSGEDLAGFVMWVYWDSKAGCVVGTSSLPRYAEFGTAVDAYRSLLGASQGLRDLKMQGLRLVRRSQIRGPEALTLSRSNALKKNVQALMPGYRLLTPGTLSLLTSASDQDEPTEEDLVDFLSKALFQMIDPAVFSRERIVISPDGMLSNLPFAMLRYGDQDLRQKEIIYTVTLAALTIADHPFTYSEPLAIAAWIQTDFDGASRDQTARTVVPPTEAHLRSRLEMGEFVSPLARQVYSKLAGTPAELNSIRMVRPDARDLVTDFRLDNDRKARLESFLDGVRDRGGLLLFATHGMSIQQSPHLSGLVLSTDTARPEDGYLTALELTQVQLSNKFVIFSTCFSGESRGVPSVGPVGIPYAATLAGARDVIVGLLPIDDSWQPTFSDAFVGAFFLNRRAQESFLSAWRTTASISRYAAAPLVLYSMEIAE